MTIARLNSRPCAGLPLILCFLVLSVASGEEKSPPKPTDYRQYLKLELARLEKLAATGGLTAESKQYLQERVTDIKDRMKTASDTVPGQMIEFMNTWAFGSKFVYLIDKSGSMSGKRLKSAKAELMRSLGQYSSETLFCVIFYDTEAKGMPGGQLVAATKENIQRCEEWLKGVKGSGKTNPATALIQAMELGPDAIFLLSDGLFDGSIPPLIRALNAQGRPAVVNAIAFMSDKGAVRLEQIASENRGQYAFIGKPKEKKPRRGFSWLPFISSDKKGD